MRFKTKVLLVAIPTAVIVATGAVIAASIHIHMLRKKKASSFLPEDVRNTLQELCLFKSEDFVPDKSGSSRFQRKLDTLTDKQLIAVYLVVTVAEVLRSRGVDIHDLSKEDVKNEVSALRSAAHDKHDRRTLLAKLGSIGVDTARSILEDGLVVAKMAAQTA